MQVEHSIRRKVALAICLVALVVVSSAQMAHSCPSDEDHALSASQHKSVITKDTFCVLCLSNFSAGSTLPTLALAPARVLAFAAPEAQPVPHQRFHEFLLSIRPPPAA